MWLPTARTEGPTSRARTSPRQALLPSSRPLPIPLAPASGMRAGPVPLPTALHERSPKTTFCLAVQPDVIKIATPVAFPMRLSAGHIEGLGTGPAHGRWHKPPARRGEDSGSGPAHGRWHKPPTRRDEDSGTGPAHGRWHKPPARRGEDSGSGPAHGRWHKPPTRRDEDSGTGPAHGRWHKPPARRGEDSGSGHARNQWHNPHAIYAKHPTSGVTPAPARHCFPPPGPCRSRMRPPRACARALSPSLPLPMSVAPKPPSALPFNQMS